MSKTKTQWFTDQVPVNVGVYKTKIVFYDGKIDSVLRFSKWDGTTWFDSSATVEIANTHSCTSHHKKHWRGLAVKP